MLFSSRDCISTAAMHKWAKTLKLPAWSCRQTALCMKHDEFAYLLCALLS